MASGKQHDRASVIASALMAGYSGFNYLSGLPWLFSALMAGGCALGLMISPDLDQAKCNAKRRWGVLGFIWFPYDKAIKHRSLVSHLPVLSTAIRLAYVSLPYQLLFGGVSWAITIPVFYGLCISDSLHWLMDGCPIGNKRGHY